MQDLGIPMVLTFQLDSYTFRKVDPWRKAHFPSTRNFLEAHLTAYHQLPGQLISPITLALREWSVGVIPPELHFDKLIHQGGFVGLSLESLELLKIKSALDTLLSGKLRAQDRRPYKPHITITNLGSPALAKKCFEELNEDFTPWSGTATGLELYHYRGGPWQLAEIFPFRALS